MNTVQNNCNISKKELQVYLEKNYKKLNISSENLTKILKVVVKRSFKKEMANVVYRQCLKRIDSDIKDVSGMHLNYEERIIIETMFMAGISNNFISIFLGKHRSSIGREINKNVIIVEDINNTKSTKKKENDKIIKLYSASKAHGKYRVNRARSRKKYILEKDPILREAVVGLIKGQKDSKTSVKIKLSPKAIAAYSKAGKITGTQTKISATAIYNASNTRAFGFSSNDLPFGRKYYKKENVHTLTKEHSEKKKEFSIEKMPDKIKNKESDTHFEGDSIIGKATGSNNTLITLVNVSTKFLIIKRAKNKTAASFVNVLNNLEEEIPELSNIMETLLLDNGCEFSDIDGIMRSGVNEKEQRLAVYYAHPYASYERGCNENKNRQVRKHFPKGTLVEELSDLDIINIARIINNTPRESLGWKTALEAFENILLSKKIDTKFLDIYRIGKIKYIA